MANFIISIDRDVKIDFAPATVAEEVLQNVRCLISTLKWQIPLARDIGISGDVVDMPILQAKARLSQEIIQCLKKYESRANVLKIDFEADVTGKLIPIVEVKIVESS